MTSFHHSPLPAVVLSATLGLLSATLGLLSATLGATACGGRSDLWFPDDERSVSAAGGVNAGGVFSGIGGAVPLGVGGAVPLGAGGGVGGQGQGGVQAGGGPGTGGGAGSSRGGGGTSSGGAGAVGGAGGSPGGGSTGGAGGRMASVCPPGTFDSPGPPAACEPWSVCGSGQVVEKMGTDTADVVCGPAPTFPARELAPGMVSGPMTASDAGVYLVAQTFPQGSAFIYRYLLDGSQVTSWEIGPSGKTVTSVDNLVQVGGDLFVSGTSVAATGPFTGRASFVQSFDPVGNLRWSIERDGTEFSWSHHLGTDGLVLFGVSDPFPATDCQTQESYGLWLTSCSDPRGQNATRRLRRLDVNGAELSVAECPDCPASPRDFKVGQNSHLYFTVGGSLGNWPLVELDATGLLFIDYRHPGPSGPSSYSDVVVSFDPAGALLLLAGVSDKAPHDTYGLSKLQPDAQPLWQTPLGSTFDDPKRFLDFVVSTDQVYLVGRRGTAGAAVPAGALAASLSAGGQFTAETAPGALLGEVFRAVALAPQGQVFVGGDTEPKTGGQRRLLVVPWEQLPLMP